jgi:hypothetical protein
MTDLLAMFSNQSQQSAFLQCSYLLVIHACMQVSPGCEVVNKDPVGRSGVHTEDDQLRTAH